MLSRLSSFSGPLSKLFNAIKGFTLDGLILRYEISNDNSYSGSNTVTDLVSNSNATLVSGPTYSINGYLNFDGVNDYLMTNTSLNSKLSPNSSSTIISVFIWVYPQDNGVIITEQGDTNLNETGWHTSIIEIVSGQLKFSVWPLTSIITSSVSISFNNWYYVGLTYDGNTLRAYIDGQNVGSAVFTRSSPPSLYYAIAAEDSTDLGDSTYAKMKFGAFHVYNKALSNQEVVSNYNYTKSNYIYTEDMLIWIDANDPVSYVSGSSILDLSGNNYTHTLSSNVTSSKIYGFNSFNCSSSTNNYIRVNGTGPMLSTSGYTYVAWARIKSDSSTWRTLYRSDPSDHALLVESGSDRLGFYDNNSDDFYPSGYDVTSIEEKWVQYSVVGDSSTSQFYINDTQVGSVSYGAGGNRHDYFGSIDNQSFGYVGNMMLYNKKLTLEEIKQNYDALKNVYKNGDFVINNLILHFNPASYLSYPGSGTTITNLVNNSLNGTLSNISSTNTYLNFNGSNSTISVVDNTLLEPGSGDWTMEVWINVSNSTGSRVVLGKIASGGNSSDISYAIRILNGNIRADFNSGAVNAVSTTDYDLTLNTWYQFTYVFNNISSNDIITYVNGQYSSTATHSYVSLQNTTTNLYLGSYNAGVTYQQWFDGKIGIVRIYNSALSASDVSKNFEANRGLYGI